jgi:putative ABC transport system substrate-binding protein
MTTGSLRRREFMALAGGAAAWPLAARAQQPAMPVVGWLDSKVASASPYQVAAFRQGLNEAGFVEGRNLAIEFRFAEDQLDRLPALAAELVRRRVAAILTHYTTTPAAKAATSTIPIVFVSADDPVETGLVSSLNRPDGYVTGVSYLGTPLNPKRLELLHELVPKPAVMALLWNQNARDSERQLRDVETAARALGRQVLIVNAGTESEIDAAFATIVQAGAGALFVNGGSFLTSRRQQIVALAARHGLPASYTRARARRGRRSDELRRQQHGRLSPWRSLMLAAFSKGRSRATCRSSCRPGTSWSSTSRPPRRSSSTFRRSCSHWQTR